MTVHEFAHYLQAYCDGELDASKMLEVEGHLQSCPACSQAVEAEQAFREELRSKIAVDPVPPHLAERLRSAITELEEREARLARPPAWERRAWLMATAASVLLLVLGGILGYLIAQPSIGPGIPPLVTEMVSDHMRFARLRDPAELQSRDTQQVAFWVEGRIGYPVRVPDYTTAGINLLGGRITRLGGRQAAYIVYEKGRSIISLFALPRYGASLSGMEQIRRDGRTFLIGEYQGHQILLWRHGNDMTYALVSNVGWDELFQCARVFFETA